jgi:hypothetical protein
MLVITVRTFSTVPCYHERTDVSYAAIARRRTPTVIIVKCGTEKEAATDRKPGNRGKRDSQLILMNFFSRVTYNDRMSPLDFDLFRKVHTLMGVTPDFFEVCLMVSYLVTTYHGESSDIIPSSRSMQTLKCFRIPSGRSSIACNTIR